MGRALPFRHTGPSIDRRPVALSVAAAIPSKQVVGLRDASPPLAPRASPSFGPSSFKSITRALSRAHLLRTHHTRKRGVTEWIFALLLALAAAEAFAASLVLGFGLDPVEDRFLADEWTWALRGGGAEFRWLAPAALSAPPPGIPLIVLDSVPLNTAARQGLEGWVRRGGVLVYAGASSALEELMDSGEIHVRRTVTAEKLLGVRYAGFDPGLRGTYPDVTAASALLNPLLPGDALRLGTDGVAHNVRLEPTDAEVLARSARLSPGPGGLVLQLSAPTVLTRRHGAGRVVFLSFSPGQVAACYPDFRRSRTPLDCSGASSARSLMRWLVANLLWEEKGLQLPLLWETPGDRPHGVIVTGDVHDHAQHWEVKAALRMAQVLDSLALPLSYYLYGKLAKTAPTDVEVLRRYKDLEIGTHSLDGKVYSAKNFGYRGFGVERGIFLDIRQAEAHLKLPSYPERRSWLVSTRSHGWMSDATGWNAMRRSGIGLVFDFVADGFQESKTPWRVPALWFDGGEQRRLFVPLYERSIATSSADFRLTESEQRDIALLASAQPEPYDRPLPYRTFVSYVLRWHALFDRLSIAGGLTEVWLFHPGGLAIWQEDAFEATRQMLKTMQAAESVLFLRGDVVASWRANRERFSVRPERDLAGAIQSLELLPAELPPVSLPPGAPAVAATTSFWVIGPLTMPGWCSRTWTDTSGRTVTVLVRALPLEPAR